MCTIIARWCGRRCARLIRSETYSSHWGRWIRWIMRRECRISDRRWELMRRESGLRRDSDGLGRMRCWWMRRRRLGWKGFGRVWGFEKRRFQHRVHGEEYGPVKWRKCMEGEEIGWDAHKG